ncbi:MAG: glycoside hydrolase family 30 protein [Solirubrobacteraceae bacterium]
MIAAVVLVGGFAARWPSGAYPTLVDPLAVSVMQTSGNLSQRLTPMPGLHFEHMVPAEGVPVISVNDSVGYQRIGGFGAAMTDSSAWLIERELPAAGRTALMSDLFGSAGLGLSFLRLSIGASDFSVGGRPYSYDDLRPRRTDPHLVHFSIAHDRAYILPALNQARALDPGIVFLASPWTPPAWMKGNDALGNVKDGATLRADAYGPWAAYIVKFIQEYASAGVPITALTAANEVGTPTTYPGLNMTLSSLSTWIRQDLMPALSRARLHPKLYGADWGWGTAARRDEAALTATTADEYTGVAWHCYYGSPDVMNAIHSQNPRLDEIVDECSPGISAIPISEVMIASLRDWASTVALWNLALDPAGGPVQAPNHGCPGCSGLVTIDEEGGALTFNLAYYQLGQASMFVQRGAERIESGHFVTYTYRKPGANFVSAGLDDVAFANPDGTRVLMAYNNGQQATLFAVDWHGTYFEYTLPAAATVTFEWDRR